MNWKLFAVFPLVLICSAMNADIMIRAKLVNNDMVVVENDTTLSADALTTIKTEGYTITLQLTRENEDGAEVVVQVLKNEDVVMDSQLNMVWEREETVEENNQGLEACGGMKLTCIAVPVITVS